MITRLGLHLRDGAVRVTVDGRPLVQDVAGVERRVVDHQDRSLAGDYADLSLDDVPGRDVTAYLATDGADAYLAEVDAVDRLLRSEPNSTHLRGPW